MNGASIGWCHPPCQEHAPGRAPELAALTSLRHMPRRAQDTLPWCEEVPRSSMDEHARRIGDGEGARATRASASRLLSHPARGTNDG